MLTVLLATRNRARLLDQVLESYCAMEQPPGGWRLVVADNGSTDSTREVLDSYRHRLPLEYVYEPRPGKNAALNSALPLVSGDLALLTDDDAFPRRDWLRQFRNVADAQVDYSIFGGLVLPRWERPPPDWLLRWVPAGPTFTLSDLATPEGPTGVENVFGPNMAIRVSALAGGLRFDETIGPGDGNYAMGSETEILMRLVQQGHKAWFAPTAVVEHMIRDTQMSKSWVLQRAVRYGRGQYRLAAQSGHTNSNVRRWWGIPRYLFLQLAMAAGAASKAALTADAEGWFRARWRFGNLRGEIAEARRSFSLSRRGTTPRT